LFQYVFLGAISIDGNQSPPTTLMFGGVNQMSIQHLMTYLLKILQVYIHNEVDRRLVIPGQKVSRP